MEHPTVFPWRTYDDAHAAIAFLESACGAQRHALHLEDDGSVGHAELRFGNGIVMLNSAREDVPATKGTGGRGTGIYITVADPTLTAGRRARPAQRSRTSPRISATRASTAHATRRAMPGTSARTSPSLRRPRPR
jgi:hypothetical protein